MVAVRLAIGLPLAWQGDGKVGRPWWPRRTAEEVTMGVNERSGLVTRYLESIEQGVMVDCDALGPDVELDATVPNWRFAVRGRTDVVNELARWYAHPGSFEEVSRTPIPGGELASFTLKWEEDGVPHAAHQVHILEVTGAHITRAQVWCGGRWPASLLAEMAEAGRG
jgi:hypothetical protein